LYCGNCRVIMTHNLSKSVVPKVMVILLTFVLFLSIPSASAQFFVGGSSSSGGGGGDSFPPTFADDSILINQNNLVEDAQNNTVVASSGSVVEFTVFASDNRGAENITYIDIFLNHNGEQILNNLKETYVSFSYGDLFIQNPHDLIQSATMDTENVGDDIKFTFNITFAQTFDTSDILLRSWDMSGNQSTLYLPDVLKIVEPVIEASIPPTESPIDELPDDIVDDTTDNVTDDIVDIPTEDILVETTSLPYSIMLGGTDGIIPYDITGAMVTGAIVNLDNNSIIFNLVDANNGTLTVSPSAETQSGIFMVLVDGEEANDVEINGNDVTVNFLAGTQSIEVIGTFVIPEFGTIAMMILIISIVSVIAISSKSRLSLRV